MFVSARCVALHINVNLVSPGNKSQTCSIIGFPSISISGFGSLYPASINLFPIPDIGIIMCIYFFILRLVLYHKDELVNFHFRKFYNYYQFYFLFLCLCSKINHLLK